MRRLTLTRLAWFFLAAIVAVVLLNVFAPGVGLIAAIVLVLVVLAALSQGVLGDSSGAHEVWASVDADRKREALQRRGDTIPPR
jgi:hypothetical protein